jgi:predicted metal-binding membrane protein
VEALLRRERVILGVCLAVVVGLAWGYLLDMARSMEGMAMDGMAMEGMAMEGTVGGEAMPSAMAMDPAPWSVADLGLLFLMWSIMMVAMMVPSAAPMALAFLSLNRRRRARSAPVISTWIFVGGYIGAWTAYSLVATMAQWGLHEAALISPSMTLNSPLLMGAVLIAAGVYQWTPLKDRCLTGCRSPLSFLMSRWREGAWGAWRMGIEHGSYCVGCCWILMALLFVTGVMNLPWVAAIALFVIAEKVVPRGDLFGRISGAAFALAGALVIAGRI